MIRYVSPLNRTLRAHFQSFVPQLIHIGKKHIYSEISHHHHPSLVRLVVGLVPLLPSPSASKSALFTNCPLVALLSVGPAMNWCLSGRLLSPQLPCEKPSGELIHSRRMSRPSTAPIHNGSGTACLCGSDSRAPPPSSRSA